MVKTQDILQPTLLLMILLVIPSYSFTTHAGNYTAYVNSDINFSTSNIRLTPNFKVLPVSDSTGRNDWDMPRCKYHDFSQIVKNCIHMYTKAFHIYCVNQDLNFPNISDIPEKPLFINNHRDTDFHNEIVLWEHWRNKWKEILSCNCNTEL